MLGRWWQQDHWGLLVPGSVRNSASKGNVAGTQWGPKVHTLIATHPQTVLEVIEVTANVQTLWGAGDDSASQVPFH